MIRVFLHSLLCLSRHVRGRLVAVEAQRLCRLATRDGVVIDIGAHCGSWMIPLSRQVAEGRVYAVEALPHYAAVLGSLVRWLGCGNVTVLNGAATEREMSLPLVWKDSHGRRLTGLTHLAGVGEPTENAVHVQGRPLDAWIPRADWSRVQLIKCDIEGAELAAFHGATGIIAAARPAVYCEINAAFCRRYGHTAADVFAFFLSRGYRAFVAADAEWREISVDAYAEKGDVLFLSERHPVPQSA
ncbi:FkbM family methyltransferase [Oleiharenicola sp. Vm1]|uniref:FkbM family methyltransferase n=1 Tax=Oleiharenicola sp. Vm1 TaxID=3398393 RepID=UPI0039F49C52